MRTSGKSKTSMKEKCNHAHVLDAKTNSMQGRTPCLTGCANRDHRDILLEHRFPLRLPLPTLIRSWWWWRTHAFDRSLPSYEGSSSSEHHKKILQPGYSSLFTRDSLMKYEERTVFIIAVVSLSLCSIARRPSHLEEWEKTTSCWWKKNGYEPS